MPAVLRSMPPNAIPFGDEVVNLNKEHSRFSVELLALATIHFTAIVSQAFAECDDNRVTVKGGGFLRATPWCDIPGPAGILAQQPLKGFLGKPPLLVREERLSRSCS